MDYQPSLFDDETIQSVEWQPSRQAGLDRIIRFMPHAGRNYANKRNFDLGINNHGNVSALSPWIKHRLIEETEVLQSVVKGHSYRAAEKFIQEVFWRGYFKGWLEHNPKVWHRYTNDVDLLQRDIQTTPEFQKRFSVATDGRTGIDCFDAWAKELKSTGYLHNHARMWFASIWIFTLKLPWQLGAQFFYKYLLDGDIASNTLSWRWVGGLHTKGKTYLARASNIEKYTNGCFNPQGQLALETVPLVEPDLPPSMALKNGDLKPDQLAGQKIGLLITPEDCRPETLNLPTPPSTILGCAQAGRSKSTPQSAFVEGFKAGAVLDALHRAEQQYQCPSMQYDHRGWMDQVLAWSNENQLDCVITPYATVGPLADQLKQLRSNLEENNMGFGQIMRPYDQYIWPYAQKGFFKLKAQIPVLLEKLDISFPLPEGEMNW